MKRLIFSPLADFQEVNINEIDVEDFVIIDSKANSETDEGLTE